MIKKKRIKEKIYLLVFHNQKQLTSTFLRFQEFYESPKFHGKVFTLEDFKKWYISVKGSFSYYTDWSGFNFPAKVLQPFYKGKFDPLSAKEKQLLDIFKRHKKLDFYIIAIYEETNKLIVKHEMAHGLFYTIPDYRKQVMHQLKKFDTRKIKKELRGKGGYAEKVLDDEVHAYALTSGHKLKTPIPNELKDAIEKIFLKFTSP